MYACVCVYTSYISAIVMLYRSMKVKVHSPDGNTDFLELVAGVLQGDAFAPYMFTIYLYCILQTSIEK